MERETRFELATPTLARLCSTTELFPLMRDFRYFAVVVKISFFAGTTVTPSLQPSSSNGIARPCW